MDTTKAFAVLS